MLRGFKSCPKSQRGNSCFSRNSKARGGFSSHGITLLFSKEEITSDPGQSPARSRSPAQLQPRSLWGQRVQ